jgi:hypothetical protein
LDVAINNYEAQASVFEGCHPYWCALAGSLVEDFSKKSPCDENGAIVYPTNGKIRPQDEGA